VDPPTAPDAAAGAPQDPAAPDSTDVPPGAAPDQKSGPAPRPKARARKPKPPGVRDQTSKTFAAGVDLLKAHVELAKAEASEIGSEGGRFAGLAAAALALVLFAATLAVLGTSMFLGEWLFGSLGWGVLHGVLTFIAVAVTLVLLAVRVDPVRIARALVIGLAVAVLASVILGLGLLNQLYVRIGDTLGLAIDPAVRPLVVGMGVGALVGLMIAILVASRITRPNWVAAVAAGVVFGILIGAFTSITFGPQIGVAIGITLGLLAWAAAMGLDVYQTGIDIESLKARYTPTLTIETSKETLEWLQQRTRRGNGS
jgi:hypothetical protein